ncbi:hypothetical protein [Streptosporangium sp. NPDC048865]|uniref:hypothetical protein n=1 Tax=Streptosporangium sp. NPDC048865 TaxID=3155766 RepID=UPI00344AF537
MIHSEDELRAALAEDVFEGPPDVWEIVRRGRRLRRRRAVTGAMGAVGAALVVAAVAFQAQGFWRGAEPVEKEPPTAARISPSSALPPENSLGAPVIESYGSTTVPDGATVTFRPLSVHTSYTMRYGRARGVPGAHGARHVLPRRPARARPSDRGSWGPRPSSGCRAGGSP